MAKPEDRTVVSEERIPLIEERLRIDKEWVETGRVRVRTVTEDVPFMVRDELRHEQVEVTRVPVNRPLEGAPEVRTEGDVTILPVVEERLVVEKRLFVVEEIHVRRIVAHDRIEQEFMLRRQRADVERTSSTEEPREE